MHLDPGLKELCLIRTMLPGQASILSGYPLG